MPKSNSSKDTLKKSLLRNAVEKMRRDALSRAKQSSKTNKRSS